MTVGNTHFDIHVLRISALLHKNAAMWANLLRVLNISILSLRKLYKEHSFQTAILILKIPKLMK
jgi:hypothetical protein